MATNEPMTDERLAEIRRMDSRAEVSMMASSDVAVRDLLAEVERLRAREAAAMEIVRAVANGATTYRDREDEYCTQDPNCMWREERPGGPTRMIHTDRCIVTKARALLADEEH